MSNEINTLQFGGLTLDPASRQLSRGAEPIVLPGKAFDVLLYMAQNPGRPLLKSELMEAVWPNSFVEEANLTQQVFLLRKALGESASAIETLPGRGYQFTARVAVLQDTPQVENQPSRPALFQATETRVLYKEEQEERVSLHQSPWGVALALVVLSLAGVAGVLGWQRYQDRVSGPPVQVLLTDFGGGTGDAVLDRSLADAERIDLAQSPFVTVVSTATVRQTMSQMLHKPDDPLTPALAHDLCERTGSQAVIESRVGRAGEHFLLTALATSCVDGSMLGSVKQEARSRDTLPAALDKLTAALRQHLGESRRTIARFSAPLFEANTGSIEALEDWSQASTLSRAGKLSEAIALDKAAVGADPHFAPAYLDLANFSISSGDKASDRLYLQKAYELRETATEPTRLYITARYNGAVTGDLFAGLQNYNMWIDLYPRSAPAWVGLSQVNRELGRHREAADAAAHALALAPRTGQIYYQLALEQVHANQVAEARTTCETALARGFDLDLVHSVLLKVAYLQNDPALAKAQADWASLHPDAAFTALGKAEEALSEGRIFDATRWLQQAGDAQRQHGLPNAATATEQEYARAYAELGDPATARRMVHEGTVDSDGEDGEALLSLAAAGETATAENLLRDALAKHKDSTRWNRVDAPQIEAMVHLAAGQPQRALAALEPARSFEPVDLEIQSLRGQAYLAMGDGRHAEAAYRELLASRYIDPLSHLVPLAWLGLGRALAAQHRRSEAAEAYRHLLLLWQRADVNWRLFQTAQAEANALLN